MTLAAAGPYPWPREIEIIGFFFISEKEFKLAKGSDPGDNMKIKGVTEVESR